MSYSQFPVRTTRAVAAVPPSRPPFISLCAEDLLTSIRCDSPTAFAVVRLISLLAKVREMETMMFSAVGAGSIYVLYFVDYLTRHANCTPGTAGVKSMSP